jgi:hypothetical protein
VLRGRIAALQVKLHAYRVLERKDGKEVDPSFESDERLVGGETVHVRGRDWVVDEVAVGNQPPGISATITVVTLTDHARRTIVEAFERFAASGEEQIVDAAAFGGLTSADLYTIAEALRHEQGLPGAVSRRQSGTLAIGPADSSSSE